MKDLIGEQGCYIMNLMGSFGINFLQSWSFYASLFRYFCIVKTSWMIKSNLSPQVCKQGLLLTITSSIAEIFHFSETSYDHATNATPDATSALFCYCQWIGQNLRSKWQTIGQVSGTVWNVIWLRKWGSRFLYWMAQMVIGMAVLQDNDFLFLDHKQQFSGNVSTLEVLWNCHGKHGECQGPAFTFSISTAKEVTHSRL